MGFLGLCQGDPLLKTLRETFGQNIIRVPEQRYEPLTVLAADRDETYFRGSLSAIVLGDAFAIDPLLIASSVMARISGRRTRAVDIDLGLKILEGFLSGFGVPPAGITTKFSGASKVSYMFQDVHREWADINSVGRILKGRIIDKENPAAAIFFGPQAYDFLILDSVITSSNFTISVERAKNTGFKLDIPAIQKIVNDSGTAVTLVSSTGLDLTFKGDKQLAFAFSCVRFALSEEGAIEALVPDDKVKALHFPESIVRDQEIYYSPDRVLLTPLPGLIEMK
jgi:hypothetical protein